MIRLVVTLFVLLAATVANASGQASGAPTATPSLAVTTLDGGEFDLARHRGKWVLVNYWATWCSPCLKEMPELSQLDRERDDVVVIGLAFEEIEKSDLEKFVAKHPVDYAIALVDVYDPPADFPVPRGLPATYLIDREGRIAEQWLGPVTSAQVLRVVDRPAAGAEPDA